MMSIPGRDLFPNQSEIREILIQQIDAQKQSVGIVVGLIESTGRSIVAHGRLDTQQEHSPDCKSVFEIGSATKVFTALLLADMVQRAEVAFTDPVAMYLPAGVRMPERGGRQITLHDLATHTSGLPRLPSNLKPKVPANPYADYSVEQLYEFLSSYALTRDIGAQYEYSNVGGGLLGHVLALRTGMNYEALVRTRICDPLGMNDTRITLSAEMASRMATGHNAALQPVPGWDIPTLAGAGALRSTAEDLLTFLAANLGYLESPLATAMHAMLSIRRPSGNPGLDIALGWHILTRNEREIIWHNGGTGGCRSFLGLDRESGAGVVVLSNVGTVAGVDDIGLHLLNRNIPLAQPPKVRAEVAVDPAVFDGYVGRYSLTPDFILAVTREGGRLFVQATGQPRFEMFPESVQRYFLRVVDAQITFQVNGDGQAISLILHQNSMNRHAKRIE